MQYSGYAVSAIVLFCTILCGVQLYNNRVISTNSTSSFVADEQTGYYNVSGLRGRLSITWGKFKYSHARHRKQKVFYSNETYYQAEGIFWPAFNSNIILSNTGTPVKFAFAETFYKPEQMISSLASFDVNKYYDELLYNNYV